MLLFLGKQFRSLTHSYWTGTLQDHFAEFVSRSGDNLAQIFSLMFKNRPVKQACEEKLKLQLLAATSWFVLFNRKETFPNSFLKV